MTMYSDSIPKISIITPSYNQGSFIGLTLRSVFQQRYPNLQYIFMDGGSTDNTSREVEPYLNKFHHFQSRRDEGQSAAIRDGLAIADGDIQAYLNSDDVLLPGSLNFVADYFAKHPHVDVIYGHRCIIDERNTVVGHWILPNHNSFLLRRWDLIPQESVFWRKRAISLCGTVDAKFRFAMDYDLFVRFMNRLTFKRVNRFLAAFRVHDKSKTATLLSTIGQNEIQEVQNKYKIKMLPIVGDLLSLYVQLRSRKFARRARCLPGLAPGLGFPIDQYWLP